MSSIITGTDGSDSKKREGNGKLLLGELLSAVQNCQMRYGGKSELATEDDVRVVVLCQRWEAVLTHGLRTSLSNARSLQSIVTAGLNFTFNVDTIGHSLWSYASLHLTKHEQERFTIVKNIDTPLGYFRAFLRASLNERSLERYLHSWIGHGLLKEYYEAGSLMRDSEATSVLPNMAAGLASILFALSTDKPELNESQLPPHGDQRREPVIPLPAPIKTSNIKKKPLRQVISFDTNDNEETSTSNQNKTLNYRLNDSRPDIQSSKWSSAPTTCLNSPDPNILIPRNNTSNSEPVTSAFRHERQFFPDTKGFETPSQILSKLSERAKEIFSSNRNVNGNNNASRDDSASDVSAPTFRISESDSEDVAGSINSSVSCLELCFTEDEASPDEDTLRCALSKQHEDYLALQLKFTQFDIMHKEKVRKLEQIIQDLNRDNVRLKDQLRMFVSGVENVETGGRDDQQSEESKQYERKLVQMAEMHAELMELNEHLQKRLRESPVRDVDTGCGVLVCIPAAFLVGEGSQSYHVYQVFVRIGNEEWNTYHRYAKFRELHVQLKNSHPDIATFKFPPRKALRKKGNISNEIADELAREVAYEQSTADYNTISIDLLLVEQRRSRLQLYLRHVVLVLPQVRLCTTRRDLINLLPFFSESCDTSVDNNQNKSSGLRRLFTRTHVDKPHIATPAPSDNIYTGL